MFAATYPTILHAEGSAKGNPEKDPFWHRLTAYVGGDGGYNYIDTDAPAELDKNGYQLDAKGMLSYSWTDITADLGGGWLYNSSTGDESTGAVLHDKVTTKAGFIRAAGRYRFTPSWELGLVNHVLLGADARFQTTEPLSNHVSWLLGPEAVYRIPTRFPIQLSGAFLTDATITNRQVYQVLVGATIGFPLQKPIEVATPTPTPTATPTPEPTPEPTVIPTPAPTPMPIVLTVTVPVRVYSFDLRPIEFAFDSDKIRPRSLPMLEKLGTFLAQHAQGWDKLTVEGHTDNRGAAAYNMKLSQRRAESVRRVLVAQGVNESAVFAEGYGLTRPRAKGNNKEAWQKNRRVDFRIEGIRDADAIDAFFREMNLGS